jgi:hypothetical protein
METITKIVQYIFPDLIGKHCPICKKVVNTTQDIIPPGLEKAICEHCNITWIDGKCINVGVWNCNHQPKSTITHSSNI